MILGIGTDLVSVTRIARLHERYGIAFARRILAPSELLELPKARHPAHFLAKRFAVKEALVKALGCGFGNGVAPRQIALAHDVAGAPCLQLSGAAAERLTALDARAQVSLSDERDYALAFVVLSRRSLESLGATASDSV